MKAKILIACLVLILASAISYAQNKIHGLIVDEKGKPLPGATVREKGKKDSVLTDAKGRFWLNIAHSGNTVIVEKIMYTSREFIPGPVLFFEIVLSKRRGPGRLLKSCKRRIYPIFYVTKRAMPVEDRGYHLPLISQ